MKITTITLGKTFNTGNYTSIRLDLTAEIDENENIDNVCKQLDATITDLRTSAITKPA